MADKPSDPMARLVKALKKLPGVGPKSAHRMAFYILRSPKRFAKELAGSIIEVSENTVFCSRCQNIAVKDPCGICSDTRRKKSTICVVEQPQDLAAVEKTGAFRGLYHVLHGALSPLEGIGPQDLRVSSFLERVEKEGIKEVILATNPNADGEATAHFLADRLKSMDVKLYRIARGIPMGASIEYIDEVTLSEALIGKKAFTK